MPLDLEKQATAIEKSNQEDLSKLHQEMLDRCIPVAREIFNLIADGTLPIGDKVIKRDADGKVIPMNADSRPQEYIDSAKKVLQLMLDANLRWFERQMVFTLVKQPMDMLQNICLMDSDKTFQDGLNNLFGVDYFGDVTMQQVDTFVKTYAEMRKQLDEPTVEKPVEATVEATADAPTVPDVKVNDNPTGTN